MILAVDVPEAPEPLALLPADDGVLSPDGTALARVIDERVMITSLASGLSFPATRGELGPESDVTWMADSRRLVLLVGMREPGELYLYDPDSGESRLLAVDATAPEVTSDGRFLEFFVHGVPFRFPLDEGS